MGGWFITTTSDLDMSRWVSVRHSDFFECYERNKLNTPFQADRIWQDAAKEIVAQCPSSKPSEAAAARSLERPYLEVEGIDNLVDTATFKQTGDPLLLISRGSGQRSRCILARI